MAFWVPSMFLLLTLIHLYHNWRIHRQSLFLSGAMVSISVFYVSHYLFIYGPSVFWLALTFGHLTPIHLLVGPFLYLYVRGVLTDRRRSRRRDLWHFVPALLDLMTRIPYLRVPWSRKLWMAQEMIRDPNRIHDFSGYFLLSPSVALTARLLSMIGYTVCCLWMVRRFQLSRPLLQGIPPMAAGAVIRFLKHLLSVCLVTELSFFTLQAIFLTQRNLTSGHIVSNPLMVLTFLGILSIPVVIQLHPEVLYGIPQWLKSTGQGEEPDDPLSGNPGNPHPIPAAVEDGDGLAATVDGPARFRALALRVERTMEERKPFLHPDFSLDDLARLMDVPKYHLYYCFNQVLQKKFTQLRAEYRVRHACRLIEAGQTREKTLEAIGFESGFSSRSAFIKAFREVTGRLPREYQQTNSSPDGTYSCRESLS